jgi:hypothetical protein
MFPTIIRNLEISEQNNSFAQCVAESSKRLFEIPGPIAVYLSVNKVHEATRVLTKTDFRFDPIPRTPSTQHCRWRNENILMIPITPKVYKKVGRDVQSVRYQSYKSVIDSSGHIIDIQDQILKSIHQKNVREIFVLKASRFEYDNVIAIIQYQYFEEHLKSLMLSSMNLRVLVVLLADNPTEFMARRVLQEMSKPDKSIKDAVVIFQDRLTGVVKLYTWLPYEPPSGRCGKFQDVLFIDDCVGGVFKYNSNIHPLKDVDNFQGCSIGYYGGTNDHPPLSISEIRFDGAIMKITNLKGINGNMANMLAEKLNMTFVRTIDENEPPDFEVRYISSTSLDKHFHRWSFTPYCTLDYTFFVVHSDAYPRWTSLTRVFTLTTWFCIFFCMFLLAVFTKWTFRSGSVAQNSLEAWCIILGVGVSHQPEKGILRIIFLSWVLCSLCLNTIYQTFVTSYFVDPGYPPQIDTLEELHSMDTPLLFDFLFTELQISYVKEGSNNSIFFVGSMDSVMYFLGTPNSSIFTHEEILYHTYKKLCKNRGPKLHKFSKVLSQIHVRLVFPEDRMLQPKLNEIIGKLVEAGISDKFRRAITFPLPKKTIRDFIEFVPLSLEHLQSLLILYLFGVCTSFIVFCFEALLSRITK